MPPHQSLVRSGLDASGKRAQGSLLSRLTIPVTVVIALFFLKLANPINYDPDLYWHLKTGEYILTHWTLPYADIFSYTAYGKEWVLHEWLSEVIFYGITAIAGLKGLDVFVAAVYTATFYLLFRLSTRLMGNPTRALIVTLVFFAPLMPFASPRPQIFTYFFFAAFLYALCEWKYRGETRALALLPVITVFWANMHGAFFAGVALLGLFITAEWAMWLAGPREDGAQRARLGKLTRWALLAVAVTLFNPRFAEYWIYPFYVVNLEVARGVISEWQSPNFHALIFKYLLAAFILFFFALIYSRKRPDLVELVVPTFFIAAGFTAVRHLPLACIAVIPFAALFAGQLSLPKDRYDRLPRFMKTREVNSELDSRLVSGLNALLLLMVAASAVYVHIRRPPSELIEGMLPVKAADFVVEKGIKGRMFNEYAYGGYLIYRLFPGQKVFIDGRADMYGDDFVNEYLDIVTGKADWREKFEKLAIDYAVLPMHAPLRQLLLAEGSFKLVYSDKRHSVLVRDVERFARLPAIGNSRAAGEN